jgi:hypothetical protein
MTLGAGPLPALRPYLASTCCEIPLRRRSRLRRGGSHFMPRWSPAGDEKVVRKTWAKPLPLASLGRGWRHFGWPNVLGMRWTSRPRSASRRRSSSAAAVGRRNGKNSRLNKLTCFDGSRSGPRCQSAPVSGDAERIKTANWRSSFLRSSGRQQAARNGQPLARTRDRFSAPRRCPTRC